ncbi:MAG TPA: hypothetical protein VJH88_00720 [Candidatus Nanoarchaeia archaeon]|nr:hypothetical protein [Candidatus Nanoarchaeia archaeon]
MKKAFATVEAVIFIGIIFFLFISSYIVYVDKSADIFISQRELREKSDCQRVASALSSIYILGSGSAVVIENKQEMTLEAAQQRIETNHTFCTFPVGRVFSSTLESTPLDITENNVTISHRGAYVEVLQ